MVSVTKRVTNTAQPEGGYINLNTFDVVRFQDDYSLNITENIHASLIGIAVDYLTRHLVTGVPLEEAFKISLRSALLVREEEYAHQLLEGIQGLGEHSIESACKLAGFDVALRSGPAAYRPVRFIQPDADTIENIQLMVKRSELFFDTYGPAVKTGFHFKGAYTNLVTKGDADFLTEYTLWDFKTSKKKPNKNDTLQLLVYYLLGKHSIHEEFEKVDLIGIFNPRLNQMWKLNVNRIPTEVIELVSKNVIGYAAR